MASELNPRQQKFVEAYLATSNGTESARLAGYAGSDKALSVQAARLLGNARVREALDARMDSVKEAMGADEILAELADIARADWREFTQVRYGKDGQVIAATLQLKDKIKALELLGKNRKLFVEKHEHSGPDGGSVPIRVEYVNDWREGK